MTQKYPMMTGSEVADRLRLAFIPQRVKVRLVDYGEDVEIEFLAEDGSTKLKLDPVPLDRLSTPAEVDVMIAQIKHQLNEA